MERLFKNLMVMLVAVSSSIAFVSCQEPPFGDDDNKPKPAEVVAVSALYSITPSQDLADFFDITVECGVDDVVGTQETISGEGWSFFKRYGDGDTIPSKYFCNAIATPKSVLPEVDVEKLYDFEAKYTIMMEQYYSDGRSTIIYYHEGKRPSIGMRGEKVQRFIDKGVQTVLNFVYPPVVEQ